jgi:hypothetical protein
MILELIDADRDAAPSTRLQLRPYLVQRLSTARAPTAVLEASRPG